MEKLNVEIHALAAMQGSAAAAWNDFQAHMKTGHVFQTTHWAHYRQRVGWTPLFVSVKTGSTIKAAAVALHRSVAGLPVGGILYVSRGPVLDYEADDAPAVFARITGALRAMSRRRLAVLRFSPDVQQGTPAAEWVLQTLLDSGFSKTPYPIQHVNTTRLDLSQSMEQLMANMDKKRRAEIRKYEENRAGWVLHVDDSPHALENFYSVYAATIENVHQRPKSLDDLRLMYQALQPAGAIYIFNVEYNGRLVAGALRVAVGKRLWGLYSGTKKDQTDISGPGTGLAMHWELIKWSKDNGFEDYDLQGFPLDSQPGDPLYGVYLFKRKWGGAQIRLIGEYDYAPFGMVKRMMESRLAKLKSGEGGE